MTLVLQMLLCHWVIQNNDQVYDITVPIISQNNLPVENQHVTILEPQELDNNIQVVSAVDANEAIIDIDVNSIIEDVGQDV